MTVKLVATACAVLLLCGGLPALATQDCDCNGLMEVIAHMTDRYTVLDADCSKKLVNVQVRVLRAHIMLALAWHLMCSSWYMSVCHRKQWKRARNAAPISSL